jgi:hypothetical protein
MHMPARVTACIHTRYAVFMYEHVLVALADASIRFVVTGGVAVALHGFERDVADLDIVVDPTQQNLDAVVTCLTRLGFWPTLPLPLSSVLVMRMLDSAGHEVDVNRVYAVPFHELLERAAHIPVYGRDIVVISRVDLIVVKQKRNREYDRDDVRMLESK